jgi:hypothetical protein
MNTPGLIQAAECVVFGTEDDSNQSCPRPTPIDRWAELAFPRLRLRPLGV